MRVGRTLRRVIMNRLISEVPGVGGRVSDRAIEMMEFPYITMGTSYWVPRNVECVNSREWTVQIDVWHRDVAKGVIEDIVNDVEAALEEWADTTAVTMSPLGVSLSRVMDDPSGALHGVVQVETMVEVSTAT